MKSRRLLLICSCGLLLTGCEMPEFVTNIKDKVLSLFSKNKKKEENTDQEENVDIKDVFKNMRELTNYSLTATSESDYSENPYVFTEKRDGNRFFSIEEGYSDNYVEIYEGKAYGYTCENGQWVSHGELDSIVDLDFTSILLNDEDFNYFNYEEKNNVYTFKFKDIDSLVASNNSPYVDKDVLKEKLEQMDLSDIEVVYEVEGKYLKKFHTTSFGLRTGDDPTNFQIFKHRLSMDFFDIGKTVVNRPEGIEVPPSNSN